MDNKNVKRYWPPPPIIESSIEYQDVNKNTNLRNTVTDYFVKKILKWIKNDDVFLKFKNMEVVLNTPEGQQIIYKLLRKFVKKTGMNWYDLRTNKDLLRKYFILKL